MGQHLAKLRRQLVKLERQQLVCDRQLVAIWPVCCKSASSVAATAEGAGATAESAGATAESAGATAEEDEAVIYWRICLCVWQRVCNAAARAGLRTRIHMGVHM